VFFLQPRGKGNDDVWAKRADLRGGGRKRDDEREGNPASSWIAVVEHQHAEKSTFLSSPWARIKRRSLSWTKGEKKGKAASVRAALSQKKEK